MFKYTLESVSKFPINLRMRPSMSEEKEPRIERLDSFFQITIGSGIPLTEDGGLPKLRNGFIRIYIFK